MRRHLRRALRGRGGRALLFAGLLAGGLAGALAGGAQAQAPQGSGTLNFDEIRHDDSQPIEINSDTLEVDQASGIARFSGDVLVTQGQLRLNAGVVEAHYAGGEGGASGRLTTLAASQKVLINAGSASAQSDEARYDVDGRQIVMTGNVVLTQAGNTVAGQRLTIDTESGTGRMEGRVRTVLRPGSSR